MATLPELRPLAFVSSTLTATTDVATLRDELDTSYVESSTGNSVNGEWVYTLDDTPTDFEKMETFSMTVRSMLSATGNDTWQVRAFLRDSAGNALHALPAYQTVTATTAATFTFSPVLPATNTKAVWDDARIVIDYVNTKSGPSDGNVIRVARAGITGTYTVAQPPVLITSSDIIVPVIVDESGPITDPTLAFKSAADSIAPVLNEQMATYPGATLYPSATTYPGSKGSDILKAEATASTAVAGSDIVATGIADVSALDIGVSATDILVNSLNDFGIVDAIELLGSDALSAQVIGDSAIRAETAVSDSPTVSLTESTAIQVGFGASDTTSVSITDETSPVDTTFSATDVVSVSLSETTQFAQVAVSGGDTISAGLTEQAAVSHIPTGSDLTSVSFTETAEAVVTGGEVLITASDSVIISTTDTGTVDSVETGAGDGLTISISESRALSLGVISSDAVSIAVTEETGTVVPSEASDLVSVSITEEPTSPLLEFVANDSLANSLTETASTVESGQVDQVASDTVSVGINEQTSVAVIITAADTLFSALLEEQVFGTIGLSGAESLSISVTDSSQSTTVEMATSDTISAGLLEESVVLNTFSAEDLVIISIADVATVDTLVEVTASDAIAIGTTESSTNEVSANPKDVLSVQAIETGEVYVFLSGSDTLVTQISDASWLMLDKASSELLSVTLAETAVAGEPPTTTFVEKASLDRLIITFKEKGRATGEKPLKVKVWDGTRWVRGTIGKRGDTSWHTPAIKIFNGKTWI